MAASSSSCVGFIPFFHALGRRGIDDDPAFTLLRLNKHAHNNTTNKQTNNYDKQTTNSFTVLEDRVASELKAEEKVLERELRDFERALEKVEKEAARRVVEEEQAVAGSLQSAFSKLGSLFGGGGK